MLHNSFTVFANRKALWKCKDCVREWNTLISTRSGGSKCPYCSGYIFLKGFNDLLTTTAVFFIKYLRTLGFYATNDIFAENAWYFRNALVRANYTNLQKGMGALQQVQD